jgi:undecaprenyl phosphate-alpha-L-ara4N flippase subunit ArnE
MTSGLILLVCLLTCCGQLCQKQAVRRWQSQQLQGWQKLLDLWLLAALAALGVGMVLWLLVLRLVPLNMAYPMLSLNFVLVTLASWLWFGEKIRLRDWYGIGCIMLGVVLIGVSL